MIKFGHLNSCDVNNFNKLWKHYCTSKNKIKNYSYLKISLRFFSISLKIFRFSCFSSQFYFIIFWTWTIIIQVLFFATEKNFRISLNVHFNKVRFLSLSRFLIKTTIFNEIQGFFTKSIKKGRLITLLWSAQNQNKSFIGKTILVWHFTDEFFNIEPILSIEKRNLFNFNGWILKGT